MARLGQPGCGWKAVIFDFPYKLGRKALGRGLYSALSRSFLGRTMGWERPETYAGIFSYYKERLGDFKGKTVCEVGSGNQYFTAFHFLNAGAARVFLVEPKVRNPQDKIKADLRSFLASQGGTPGLEDAASRVVMLPDLAALGSELDGCMDLICSHLVLEHVSDLDGLFRHTARLLSPQGRAHHRVDLSDHTYHVFAKFPILRDIATRRSLFHLRYSDRVFSLLNDPKCYMNRRLLPEFLRAAEGRGLKAEYRVVNRMENTRVHSDLRARCVGRDGGLLKAVEFSLELRKR